MLQMNFHHVMKDSIFENTRRLWSTWFMYLYTKVFWTWENPLLSVSKTPWLSLYQLLALQYVEEGHSYPGKQVFQVVPKNK